MRDTSTGEHPELTGHIIGNYRILRALGAGRVGAVYLAERADGEFVQNVVLTLIAREVQTDPDASRFIDERQRFAALEHPRVARLIDRGATDDGTPFFVVEHIDGVDIIAHADARALSLPARLALFTSLCDVVSFAHQHLVIHRDLQPANIVVTAHGDVKLRDLGIVTTHDASSSYASPEQRRRERLTTATDVYSLGVVLYQLLTGAHPHRTADVASGAITKGSDASAPASPSTRRTVLKGDLDNIILTALREDPHTRYESVEQFADDIRRYQQARPVTATADTWRYRAATFARRHRVALGSVAAVGLTLLAGFGATSWQQRVAARERDNATNRSDNLRRISNTLVSDVERAIRDLPGSMPARRKLLERAVEQLNTLTADSSGTTPLQLDLVWAYQNLASMPDAPLTVRRRLYERTFELIGAVRPDDARDLAVRDRLAMMHLDYLFVTRSRLDVAGTVEHTKQAVALVDQLRREFSGRPDLEDSFWTANYHRMLTLQQLGHAAAMIEAGHRILPTAEYLYRENPANTDSYNFMKPHLTHMGIGYGLAYAGQYDQAIAEFRIALDACLREQKVRPDADILRNNESSIRLQRSNALAESGRFAEALVDAERSLAIRERLAAANPTNFDYQLVVADGHLNTGRVLLRSGAFARAEASLHRAAELFGQLIARDPERTTTSFYLARTRIALGTALSSRGNGPEAAAQFEQARTFLESVGAEASDDAGLARAHAEVMARLALLHQRVATDKAQTAHEVDAAFGAWDALIKRDVVRASDRVVIAELQRTARKAGWAESQTLR